MVLAILAAFVVLIIGVIIGMKVGIDRPDMFLIGCVTGVTSIGAAFAFLIPEICR